MKKIFYSILIATPKYFVGTHIVMGYSLFVVINSTLKINNSKYELINNQRGNKN